MHRQHKDYKGGSAGGYMDGATITPDDLEAIYDDIRTKCAIYTDEVKYGVQIALTAVYKLSKKRYNTVSDLFNT